ncbi:MAG TPA: hypothetical protein VGK02_00685 [Candidatus Aquicultor sp.]|jgi:hypothetical protein
MTLDAKCRATAIGSVPHTDVDAACKLVFDSLPEIPMWPQLPNVNYKESIYVQYSEGMPGLVVDEPERRVWFDSTGDVISELDRLFQAYMNDDVEALAISPQYAQGLYAFLDLLKTGEHPAISMLKGHIIGPLTIGYTVADQNKKPGIYDEVIREGIIKTLVMKAKWQVKKFKEVRPDLPALIFIDDPSIMSIGSALVSMNRDDVIGYLNEIIDAVDAFTGIHCCGNTDWSVLAATNTDVISFDAYEYSETLALYPNEMKAFLNRGGVLAWGIVPSGLPTPTQVADETVESLARRLEAGMQLLVDRGIDKELILRQALITPNCGTGTMQPSMAERTFTLTHGVSNTMRERYFG